MILTLAKEMPLNHVRVGDLFCIRPGDMLPVGYKAVEGSSSVLQPMITGEPMAVSNRIGNMVIDVTLNTSGTLVMRPERVSSGAILAQIVQMVAMPRCAENH